MVIRSMVDSETDTQLAAPVLGGRRTGRRGADGIILVPAGVGRLSVMPPACG